jgi:hypothetical protein
VTSRCLTSPSYFELLLVRFASKHLLLWLLLSGAAAATTAGGLEVRKDTRRKCITCCT